MRSKVASQVTSESLGWPPNVGTWLCTGRDSRASHGEVKEGPSREETRYAECGPSWKASATPRYGAVSVYRGGSFHGLMSGRVFQLFCGKGGDFQELVSTPTF